MNCLKCGKEIMKTKISEKDGSGQMALGESKKIMYDGENEYIPCPHCGVKNILSVVIPRIKGTMRQKLTKYEE